MKTGLPFFTLIIGIMLGAFLFKGCDNPDYNDGREKIVYKEGKTIRDTVVKDTTIYKDRFKYITLTDTIIIQEGILPLSIKAYSEEYYNADRSVKVNVKDTIAGRLFSQSVNIESMQVNSSRTDTIFIPESPRNKVYAGVYAGMTPMQEFDYGLALSLANKRGGMLSVKGNPFTKSISLTYQSLIKF